MLRASFSKESSSSLTFVLVINLYVYQPTLSDHMHQKVYFLRTKIIAMDVTRTCDFFLNVFRVYAGFS